MRPRHAAVALGFIAASLCLAGAEPRIELGPPETVLAHGQLGLSYFPDGPLAVVRSEPDCRVLVAAGVSSFLLDGPTMGRFTSARKVLDPGPPGAFDNGYAGISAVVRARSGELLAFYHAEDQEGMKSVGNGVPGFCCRVALAVSKDEGLTFEKRGPILSGRLPKDPSGPGDQGVGEPWVIAEPEGEFLYAYYTSHERVDARGVQICLARCPVADAQTPGAWKKFHLGGFSEPGLGGTDTPVVSGALKAADALFPNVVFVPTLRQFVMVFCMNVWRKGAKPERSGIYAAFSEDGIHWPPEAMKQVWAVPTVATIDREVAWHPTFIPGESAAGEMKGSLYYGYSEKWGHQPPNKPHFLTRRLLTISFKP